MTNLSFTLRPVLRWPGTALGGCLIAVMLLAGPLAAAPLLNLPAGAEETGSETRPGSSYRLAVGPWSGEDMAVIETEGTVSQTAWRIRSASPSTLATITALRDQLAAQGFEVLYQCVTDVCGGFDFRFANQTLAEPDMHVDLGDFRYLAARRTGEGEPEYVGLLVSRSSDSDYLQITRIGAGIDIAAAPGMATGAPALPPPAASGDIAAEMTGNGMAVLRDLDFPSGSGDLGPGRYASLDALAAFLKANPGTVVTLVGHTDFTGTLAPNLALSRQRAQSVMRHLIADYGVDRAQVAADGVGYLSPVTTNLTPEGRAENRRVEALITSTR